MKKQFSLLLFALLLFSCGEKKTPEQVAAQAEKTATISVNSMICNTCAKTITAAVKNVSGVNNVSVDVDKKTATITFLPARTTLARLETAITEAGYNANDKKRNPASYANLPACCKEE